MGICRLSERVGLGSVSAVRVSACKCVASSVCAQVRPTKRAERQGRLFHGLRWRPHVLDDDFRHHLSGVCVEARLSLNKARPSGRNAQCQAYIQQAEPEPRVQARRQLPHQHREAVAVRLGRDSLALLRHSAVQHSSTVPHAVFRRPCDGRRCGWTMCEGHSLDQPVQHAIPLRAIPT